MRRAMNNRSLIGRWKEVLFWVGKKSGKTFIEFDEKGTTRTCCICNHVEPGGIPVNIRKWKCPKCDAEHIRDENAAINGLKKVLLDLSKKQEEGEMPFSLVSCSDPAFIKKRSAWCVLPSGVKITSRGQNSNSHCSIRKLKRRRGSLRSKLNQASKFAQV